MRVPERRSRPAPVVARGTGQRPGSRAGAHPVRGGIDRGTRGVRFRFPRARLPRFTPGRAGALLGIIGALGAIYGLAATSAFTYARAEIPDLRWTTRASIESAIAIPVGTNLFRLAVEPLEERIRRLPGVADAIVVVSLPDTLAVEVTERQAILAWSVGEMRFLVDRNGVLFAVAEPGVVASAGLPVIADSRSDSARLAVGDALNPIDLDAATRLGALVPGDIDSVADALLVTVNEANGFVVGTSPASWIAVFGLYTPSVRTADIIPGQVRLLRSLLDGRESAIAQVILADADNGTFIPKPTPPGPNP